MNKSSICIYLQVHQPFRIKKYFPANIGKDHKYFQSPSKSEINNRNIFERVSKKSYLPVNQILLKLLKKHKDFKINLSFSGTVLEQMERFSPETLKSFQNLYNTGKVEILSETYYHSLAFFYSITEFEKQVEMHRRKVKKLFGAVPVVFRNTELSYNNKLAKWAENAGYKGLLTEGWERFLKKRSPNVLYRSRGCKNIKTLLRNYHLSDDISFRFSERNWSGWPLYPSKFVKSIKRQKNRGDTVNLFMDYETFGEHQWKETGIFDFLEKLPAEILKNGILFKTVSETIDGFKVKSELDVPKVLTWADTERDLSAWTDNKMQKSSITSLYKMEEKVLATRNKKILEDWRKLQTSDHFYYMCTKWFADGDVHAYFNPYKSPYDAYKFFTNVLKDFKLRLRQKEV